MKSEQRDGMQIDWDAPIEMEDGVVLRADVFRPIGGGKHPVILSYGPYAKGLAFQEGYQGNWDRLTKAAPEVLEGSTNKYQVWELVDPEKWVPDGYACVRVDSRGAGRSPGYIDIWSAREALDIYHCIEWAGTQPWSSGKVGMNGISYFATNQWQVGALKPPHLAALCIWEGFADYYRELARHGGILSGFTQSWYKRQVLRVQHGVGDNGPQQPRHRRAGGGAGDLAAGRTREERADAGGEVFAAAVHRRLLPRSHGGVRADRSAAALGRQLGRRRPASARQFRRLSARGLQAEMARGAWRHALHALLQQLRDGAAEALLRPLPQRRRHRLGQAAARRAQHPPSRRKLHAARRGRMADPAYAVDEILPAAGQEGSRRVAPTRATTLAYETTGDGITFLTPPMTQELEVTGPVAAKLWLSSDTTDADVFLALRVFDPAGKEVTFIGSNDPRTPVGLGWLRASHRKLDPKETLPYRPFHTHDEAWPLEPGKPAELDIEIWPTSIVVPPGYRLGLTVRGKDYEVDGADGGFANAMYPMKGVGPFTHTDPSDRPPEIFGGTNVLHFAGDKMPYRPAADHSAVISGKGMSRKRDTVRKDGGMRPRRTTVCQCVFPSPRC